VIIYKAIELEGVVNWECDFSTKKHGEGIAMWFATKLGLCNERIDTRKELDDTHATLAECEAMCEKKNSHNGFKYETCTNLEITIRVLEFYPLLC
jgi:hypothetical protein